MHAARVSDHRLSVAARQAGIAWINAVRAVCAIGALDGHGLCMIPTALAVIKAKESPVVCNSRIKNER